MAPSLGSEFVLLAAVGAASVTFAAGINSSLQLAAAPEMRGRVMALYSVVFLGSTPIGGPLAGWMSGAFGPRSALVLAGIAALVGGAVLWSNLIRRPAPPRQRQSSCMTRRTSWRPSISRCTSVDVLCTAKDARAVAPTPSLRISGCAQ